MSDPTFRQLLRGKHAHVNPVASLRGGSCGRGGQEGRRISGFRLADRGPHELLDGLRTAEDRERTSPEHAIESWPSSVSPASAQEWRRERDRLASPIQKLATLSESALEVLSAPVDAGNEGAAAQPSSLQAVLWQTLVHNRDHAGQIALLLRCFGLWPAENRR